MTDVEKLRQLLADFGIPFTECPVIRPPELRTPEDVWFISIDNWGDCEKIGGYTGFGGTFDFDDSGKFVRINFWE